MKKRMLALLLAAALLLSLAPAAHAGQDDDALLVEALKQFFAVAEGDYGAVNANDGGAASIGLLQWHGARALELLRFALKGWPGCGSSLPEALRREIAASGTDWRSRTLSAAEARAVSALLASPEGRAAQDEQARQDILGYVALARSWGMQTKATAAYFAVIINQFGSGGAASYLRHIRATLGVGEDAVFRNLYVLHRAVHDTDYGRSGLAMRDRSYAYLCGLGWDLNGAARPLPAAESPLSRLAARRGWRLPALPALAPGLWPE